MSIRQFGSSAYLLERKTNYDALNKESRKGNCKRFLLSTGYGLNVLYTCTAVCMSPDERRRNDKSQQLLSSRKSIGTRLRYVRCWSLLYRPLIALLGVKDNHLGINFISSHDVGQV